MTTCHYCGGTEDLRPYGPGGAPICYPCGTTPEHNASTVAAFNAQVSAAMALFGEGGGLVIIDAETGDMRVASFEEILEHGGLPESDET